MATLTGLTTPVERSEEDPVGYARRAAPPIHNPERYGPWTYYSEMKRQSGLPGLESGRQFTDTLLSLLQPSLIGQGMEEDSRFDSLFRRHRK